MWVGIFVTLHLTALFLTLYEWNSPFGMTPHGRNRLRVFSYSSALNLCYAILFGRTVATKVRSAPHPCVINGHRERGWAGELGIA